MEIWKPINQLLVLLPITELNTNDELVYYLTNQMQISWLPKLVISSQIKYN